MPSRSRRSSIAWPIALICGWLWPEHRRKVFGESSYPREIEDRNIDGLFIPEPLQRPGELRGEESWVSLVQSLPLNVFLHALWHKPVDAFLFFQAATNFGRRNMARNRREQMDGRFAQGNLLRVRFARPAQLFGRNHEPERIQFESGTACDDEIGAIEQSFVILPRRKLEKLVPRPR